MAITLQGVAPLLQVFDMPASVRFYKELLGFEMVTHSPGYNSDGDFHWALLRRDGVELMLNTLYDEGQQPPAPDGPRVAAHGDTILYFGCADLDAAYHDLLARGLSLEPPVTQSYGMKQLSLKDPDGYGLCFQCPA